MSASRSHPSLASDHDSPELPGCLRFRTLAVVAAALAIIGVGVSALMGSDDSQTGSHRADPTPAVRTSLEAPAPATSAAPPVATPPPSPSRPSPTNPAREALEELPAKGRAPMTGYSREAFGQRWADTDRNGCDTRNDVLRRDLTDVALKPGTHGCVVLAGTLADPYTGERIAFQRGPATSQAVQIDHVVAMGNAWVTGAQNLDDLTRQEFANDPLNLLAVSGAANQQKLAGDAATWLPANTRFRCAYVARQVAVKRRYHLWVTPAERDAIARVLRSCPGQTLPGEGAQGG